MRFAQMIARFLYGRYATQGVDILNRLLAVIAIIIAALNLFLQSMALYVIQTAVIFWFLFRMLSRNISARRSENLVLLNLAKKVKTSLSISKRRFKERSTHIYKTCPNCKAKLRFARIKGVHNACCPCCKKSFSVKVR